MENFVNIAKQFAGGNDDDERRQGQGYGQQQGYGREDGYGREEGYGRQQEYGREQGYGRDEYGQQGGAQFNAPHGQGGSGGFGDMLSMFNQGSAMTGAQQALGHNQTDPGLQAVLAQGFAQTQAYGHNAVSNGRDLDMNDDGIIDDYERAYSRGEAERGNMSSESMGTAAAMAAFKKFAGGGGAQQSSGGGDMQSKLVGMAMAEAIKLFSNSGGATTNGGGQQDVVNAAGKQIMKMMIKSQMSGAMGTGGGGGGMGGLMSMASKFM